MTNSPSAAGALQPWCAGLPVVGERPLTAEERQRLLGMVARAKRGTLFERGLTWLVMIGPAVLLAMDSPPSGLRTAIGFAFASLGLSIVVAAPAGALMEVAAPQVPWSRWLFALWGLLATVSFGFDLVRANTGLLNAIFSIPVMLGGLAGAGVFLVRWLRCRRSVKMRRQVEVDLAHGVVRCHAGPAATARVYAPELFPDATGENAPGDVQLAVLPSSGVLLNLDGQPLTTWTQLESTFVAPHESLSDAPYETDEPVEHELRQRHMSEAERAELRKVSARLLRRSAATALGATWMAAVVIRIVENHLLDRRLQAGLSPLGWTAALLVGAFCTRRVFLHRARLRRDMGEGKIVVMRNVPGEHEGEMAEIEVLPHSDTVWSVNGELAEWRKARWW